MSSPSTTVDRPQSHAIVKRDEARELLPPVLAAIERRNILVQYSQKIMIESKDFGTIPGTDKPTLLKPGAEKLCNLFGLCVEKPEIVEKEEDWTGERHGGESFFYYLFCQRLTRGGETVAAQLGSCNSWEKKYRYRWVPRHEVPEGTNPDSLKKQGGKVSEFSFAVDKAETSGKYGKPAEYWQTFRDAIARGLARSFEKKLKSGELRPAWEIDTTLYRIPNLDVADQVNSILKMAQKRALVAATLVATNASEFYTQDVEDMEVIDAQYTVVSPPASPPPPARANETQAAVPDLVNEKHVAELQALMQRKGVSWQRIVKGQRLPTNYEPNDLTVQQWDAITGKLNAKHADSPSAN